jgi:hypothetical protein
MRQSPALLRARAPYLVKNWLLGSAIFATAISICESYPPMFYGWFED